MFSLNCNVSLLVLQVYCAFTSFMLAYHTHEKAIMTVIIPLSLVATSSRSHAQLYLRTSSIGHFGLLPLLFRQQEALLKVLLYLLHVSISVGLLQNISEVSKQESQLITIWDKLGSVTIVLVLVFVEIVHPIFLGSQEVMEFLPLMIQSVVCAFGLILCWLHSFLLMLESTC